MDVMYFFESDFRGNFRVTCRGALCLNGLARRGARLQLLRYVVRILTDWYERNERRLPLPPVLPLLVHQGPEGWRLSTEFVDLFGDVPEPMRAYLPSFRHALVDVGAVDDGSLSGLVRLRRLLQVLKYSRRRDLNECLAVIFAEPEPMQERDALNVVTYLNKVPVRVNRNRLVQALLQIAPEEQVMGWLDQPFFDQGKVEGEAKALTRILESRFGSVPDSVRQRIFAAKVGEIDGWLDRVCHAPDLRSVFDSN